MTPTAKARTLHWPDCWNVRDLGSLPVSGGVTRTGALIRSDSLHHLTPAGVAQVRSAGVSRVIDLRTEVESGLDPNPFRGTPTYVNRPVQGVDDPGQPDGTLLDVYVAMLDAHPELFVAVVGEVADAPPGGVVVHCHAGKDRTGLVTALLLSSVGVDEDAVVSDYAHRGDGLLLEAERVIGIAADDRRDWTIDRQAAVPETMVAVLRHLEERYGGAASYLRSGGLTEAQEQALRRRLLE